MEATAPTWHVISPGARRLEIFGRPEDCRKLLDLLAASAAEHGAAVHAFALLPNHYHLLVTAQRHALGKLMHGVNRPYSRWHNKRMDLRGHSFDGAFRRTLLRSPFWILRTTAYIHLNPVSAGLAKSPDQHAWSSCSAYFGRPSPLTGLVVDPILRILNPDLKAARAAYRRFLDGCNPAGIPAGAPTAAQVWAHLARSILQAVRDDAPELPRVAPAVLATCLGRHAGVPMRSLSRACGLHDPNTAHVLTYRLRKRLARDRNLAATLRRWTDAMGLDFPASPRRGV